jgi:3-oxoacyl-[acyl-carrier-protein] synthase-3
MRAAIKAIEYALPGKTVTNADLVAEFPDWTVDKIEEKTGIRQRPIASADECASDLGVVAAERLFSSGVCSPEQIDYLLFCTQSPDYFLPTTACVMQERLGLPRTVGALDFNLGCSGYVYGLGLAKGLIETGQARNVLLITGETYSKHIHPGDKSVRTLFGDAGTATLIQGIEASEERVGPFVYGTDGGGAKNLIVPQGGMRSPMGRTPAEVVTDAHGNQRSTEHLYMNGSEIFTFTLLTVPKSVKALLDKAGIEPDQVDLYVFHQANKFMLDALRKKVKIPEDKFFLAYEKFGNTVSCTIPIALKEAVDCGVLRPGMTVVLVGFGVGYSWGANLVRWI